MTKARDISKLLSTANGKIAGSNLDVSFENIADTGTEGTKVAVGTTAQRGSTQGQFRFNSTTGLAEYYNGSSFTKIEGTPVVTSISPNNIDTDSNALPQNITITGNNFQSGATVTFIDSAGVAVNSTSVSFTNSTTLVAQVPNSVNIVQQPFDVRVNNPTGLSATLTDGLQISAAPTWSTSSGSLGSVGDRTNANFSVSATDPDGGAITYSESAGVLSGAGLSLNGATGAITGTPNDVSSNTTINFTITATDNEGSTANRSFSITINYQLDGSSARPFNTVSDADGVITSGNQYYIKTSSSGTDNLYFYVYNGYAYALVNARYKSSSAQTSVNTNGSHGTIGNAQTFGIGVTKMNYMNNQIGLAIIPQQADGALNTNNSLANIFRNASTPSLPTDVFTNNHAGETSTGLQVRGIDLDNLNPNSVPTDYWEALETNSHEGGNQILSQFSTPSQTVANAGGTEALGFRYSNANGVGYHDGSQSMGNDTTGSARDLHNSEPISLFCLLR